MAFALLAFIVTIHVLNGMNDRRGYVRVGWPPSDKADTLIGMALIAFWGLFIASFLL